jgi:ABC-2 type transport system ATP-binding protein
MSDDVAIKVEDVSKDFRLPHEKTTSVKNIFVNFFHNIQHKRTFAAQHALKNIDFEIKKGEFFGIVGRNGSGKSTLLKILAGIYQPTHGQVEVQGKLVPFIELGVGFNPELTGRENVFLNGALLGFSEDEVGAMYDEIVEFAELHKFMDQKLKNYSSGMQVRLAFSMAIRAEADILLVDEVLAVGDADFQRKCFSYFRQLKRNKKTVVFVSHDMEAVKQYCDRAVLLEKSSLILEGRPEIVASQYNRMFMKEAEKKSKQEAERKTLGKAKGPSGEERWGDGTVVFEKISAVVSEDQQNIVIQASCKAAQHVDVPIFGFSIKNQLLQQLIGTNTVRKGLKLTPIKKGETRQITWTVPNILNTGEYYVDCTVAHDDAISVADRWPEVATLKIYRDESNPYIVYSPDIAFNDA